MTNIKRKPGAQPGHPTSPETRAKLSKANTGKLRGPQSPEYVAKRMAGFAAAMVRRKAAKQATEKQANQN